MVFNHTVTFTVGGPTKWNLSVPIKNDMIALEEDEVVQVHLIIESPASGVNLGKFNTTLVTIVDDDSKFNRV